MIRVLTLIMFIQKSDKTKLARTAAAASKKDDNNNDDEKYYEKSCAEALKPIEETLSAYTSSRHRMILTTTR